ncbi:uncharacterized protein K02A2.6-like [Diabrotica virgifera virgifera]|uniref:Peptidase A2 domain-containing protein n=1 Tax=Diabrotica virgifera virgifera TaxID=50390 RepID=A0ABM5L6A5_DIAVI|nr:uncharacterized protein K02A2.6-like [Diabrotica virgifera virgifera]
MVVMKLVEVMSNVSHALDVVKAMIRQNVQPKHGNVFFCKRVGHTSTVCRSKVSLLEEGDIQGEVKEEDSLFLGLLSSLEPENSAPEKIILEVEGNSILFDIDTGACRTVIHIHDFKKFLSELNIYSVNYCLKVLTGQGVKIMGETDVLVKYKNNFVKLPIVILESKYNFTPLLGRNWLNVLHPKWRQKVNFSQSEFVSQLELENLETASLITEIKKEFESDFDENSNSFIKHFEIDLNLKENVQPIFHRAYDMPFALKDKVEQELKKLVELGILQKVSYSNWASPIVVVPKKSSEELRICVDFKKTLNKVLDSDHCALPLPENIFACLSGHKYFTVLDLKGAYQQQKVSKNTQKL